MSQPTEAQLRAFYAWAHEFDFSDGPPTIRLPTGELISSSSAAAFAAGWNAIAPPADTEPPTYTTCDKCGDPSWWFSDAGYCKRCSSKRGEAELLTIDPDRLTQIVGRELAAEVLRVSGTTTRCHSSGLDDYEAQELDLGDPRK